MAELFWFEDFPIGKTWQFGRYLVTDDQIQSYAAAFDPLLGGRNVGSAGDAALASPLQLGAILMRVNFDGWMDRAAARGAPGVDEVRWFRRVHGGESLTARYTVRDARTSRSKPDLGLIQYHYELLDAEQQPVLSQRNWVMMLRRNPGEPARESASGSRPSGANGTTEGTASSATDVARIQLGSVEFTADAILEFARAYDPQPFHVDADKARHGPFGQLAASGWHTMANWARAYAQAYRSATTALPRPRNLLALTALQWRKPVFVGDRITFDYRPVASQRSAGGEEIVTSLNRGIDQNGTTVLEFTLAMSVAAP